MGNRTKRALDLAAFTERRNEAAAAEREARSAGRTVCIWNAKRASGRALWYWPTIAAAIAAKRPWLAYECPTCRSVATLDLRTVRDRHPQAAISSLIPSLPCARCGRDAPFARLVQLVPRSDSRTLGRLGLKPIGREEYLVRYQGHVVGQIVLQVADFEARGPWFWKVDEAYWPTDGTYVVFQGYRRTRTAAQRAFREAWELALAPGAIHSARRDFRGE